MVNAVLSPILFIPEPHIRRRRLRVLERRFRGPPRFAYALAASGPHPRSAGKSPTHPGRSLSLGGPIVRIGEASRASDSPLSKASGVATDTSGAVFDRARQSICRHSAHRAGRRESGIFG